MAMNLPRGHQHYQSADYGADGAKVSLDADSIGSFVFCALMHGMRVNSVYALNAKYAGSYVQVALDGTPEQAAKVSAASGIQLEPLATLQPAGGDLGFN